MAESVVARRSRIDVEIVRCKRAEDTVAKALEDVRFVEYGASAILVRNSLIEAATKLASIRLNLISDKARAR